jgi:hypothetical protein
LSAALPLSRLPKISSDKFISLQTGSMDVFLLPVQDRITSTAEANIEGE